MDKDKGNENITFLNDSFTKNRGSVHSLAPPASAGRMKVLPAHFSMSRICDRLFNCSDMANWTIIQLEHFLTDSINFIH